MKLSLRATVCGLLAGGVATALLAVRLSSYGIWDPWELTFADDARQLLEGGSLSSSHPPLAVWSVALAFEWFGIHGWAGRTPMVISGIIAALCAFGIGRRFHSPRAGLYAAVATATTPLVLMTSRQMLADGPAIAAQAVIGLALLSAFYGRSTPNQSPWWAPWASMGSWLLVAAAGIAAGTLSRGVLLGVLPPLVAVAILVGLDGIVLRPKADPLRAAAGVVILSCAVTALWGVTRAVLQDEAGYSHWLGSKPVGGQPPSFEGAVAGAFHGFGPWSGLAAVALAYTLRRPGPARRQRIQWHASMALLLWAVFGAVAATLYSARYGAAPYVAVVAVSSAIGMFVRNAEEHTTSLWPEAAVATLLSALALRDFALYPGSLVHSLGLVDFEMPDIYNPRSAWALCFTAFAVATIPALAASTPERAWPDLMAPYRMIREQWRRKGGTRAWIVVTITLLVLLAIVGLIASVEPRVLGLTTLASKWAKRLALIAPLAAVLIAVGQSVFFAFGRLGPYRMLPLMVVAVGTGLYVTQGFQPALSAHVSPRAVYESYNELASSGEVLGEYGVGTRAARYYTPNVQEISSQADLVQFLRDSDRRWAVVPTDELGAIDRAFRQHEGQHLFVADGRSARVLLVTNHPVEGRANQNPLTTSVLDKAPTPQHAVGARYENNIELVGYDLLTPHGGYAGAGETIELTWYWHSLRSGIGTWTIFVHIDGPGLRLNGDHEPLKKTYPVNLWLKDDVIVDKQTLTVPANFRPGTYTIYVGFFRGNTRMRVSEGPKDNADRVIAGTLKIR